MKPVLVRINKKTVEPSPSPKHDYRISFRFKKKIDYRDSEYIFKNVGNPRLGYIETDAQFAKYLKDNFGLGKYLVWIWKKKRARFSVYYFDCSNPKVFSQIPKKKTKEKEDTEKSLRKIRRLKEELKKTNNEFRKKSLKKDIEELKEDVGFNRELSELDLELYQKKVSVFKNTKPIYHDHEYKNYGNEDSSSDYDKEYYSGLW